MEKDREYYCYNPEVQAPDQEETDFWEKHPGIVNSIFLGGLFSASILATVASIELIAWVTARKVVKKLEKGR